MANPVADLHNDLHLGHAVVFVNAAAGGGRARGVLPRIQRLFEAHSFPADFVETKNAEDLGLRVRAAIEGGKRLLLAMGGDGTFQGLANVAFGADVVLGVLPAGGGNDFAAGLGFPEDAVEAAKVLLQARPRWVDLARVRTADGREKLFAGGGGVGLDAEAARHASGALRRVPGRLRYIAAALRALCTYELLEVHAEFPESKLPALEAKALLACVLNTPTYGAGLRLAPGARSDDGWLDFVVIEDLSAAKVLALLPRLMYSGELRTPQVKRMRVRRVRLTTGRPCMFHGDGEILGPAPVEIEVVARAVRVLAPTED